MRRTQLCGLTVGQNAHAHAIAAAATNTAGASQTGGSAGHAKYAAAPPISASGTQRIARPAWASTNARQLSESAGFARLVALNCDVLWRPSMTVVTRFAPSPTGYLHIGGARTALFNWLYARHFGGTYLLRIEDTDRARSTPEATAAILEGLSWLGLDADGQTTYQSKRADLHRQAAEAMVERGTAYRAYETTEELDLRRTKAAHFRPRLAKLRQLQAELAKGDPTRKLSRDDPEFAGLSSDDMIGISSDDLETAESAVRVLDRVFALHTAYRSPYREGLKPPSPDAPYVVRLRAPDSGDIVNEDLVQGTVKTAARDIDDLILLRADGTPTYMLSVVVDDYDMGVTHVIRGDDHLTNAARQIPIFDAMGWQKPAYAHIPLIHGPDGAKLSKRHGAQAVHEYRDMGYLPEALLNYLARLGWSHGDDEIFSLEQAARWFDVKDVNKGAARLDFDKLASVNAHYLREADNTRLAKVLFDFIASQRPWTLDETTKTRVRAALTVLKARAKTVADLAEQAFFLIRPRPVLDAGPEKAMKEEELLRLRKLRSRLQTEADWTSPALETALKDFAREEGVGMGQIGPSLRRAVTGGAPAPDLGTTLSLLGKDETLSRLGDLGGGS
jgi:glutamyl-tRNA synthetase